MVRGSVLQALQAGRKQWQLVHQVQLHNVHLHNVHLERVERLIQQLRRIQQAFVRRAVFLNDSNRGSEDGRVVGFMVPKTPSGRSRKVGKVPKARSSKPPTPEITIEERPAGRDTLNAILREMRSPTSRKPFVTIGYDEKPLGQDRPAKNARVVSCRDAPDAMPEVTVTETRPGFETMAIIDEELLRDASSLSRLQEERSYADADVLELFTFVILDRRLSTNASNEEKRAFVEQRLWHRLPPGGVAAVRRIDVRPADETALMMRIWCAVPKLAKQD